MERRMSEVLRVSGELIDIQQANRLVEVVGGPRSIKSSTVPIPPGNAMHARWLTAISAPTETKELFGEVADLPNQDSMGCL
jgi:hypothetical protein